MKRSIALVILSIDVGTQAEDHFCHSFLVLHASMVKASVALAIPLVNIFLRQLGFQLLDFAVTGKMPDCFRPTAAAHPICQLAASRHPSIIVRISPRSSGDVACFGLWFRWALVVQPILDLLFLIVLGLLFVFLLDGSLLDASIFHFALQLVNFSLSLLLFSLHLHLVPSSLKLDGLPQAILFHPDTCTLLIFTFAQSLFFPFLGLLFLLGQHFGLQRQSL
mmetsp:Transcript_24330/g.38241  ORF Transcript_24330/g.38241 Transcript_24330/m.38241 type:complete len:221 (-) Transcript_24330:664-1326(-)